MWLVGGVSGGEGWWVFRFGVREFSGRFGGNLVVVGVRRFGYSWSMGMGFNIVSGEECYRLGFIGC